MRSATLFQQKKNRDPEVLHAHHWALQTHVEVKPLFQKYSFCIEGRMLVGFYCTYLAGVADPGGIAFARSPQTHRHGSEGAFPLMAALAWHGLHPARDRSGMAEVQSRCLARYWSTSVNAEAAREKVCSIVRRSCAQFFMKPSISPQASIVRKLYQPPSGRLWAWT